MLVDDALARGETVNILSGVHGPAGGVGRITQNLHFKIEDVARFNRPGLIIWRCDQMTTTERTTLLNASETTIGGFCYGGMCLRPYMNDILPR